MEGFDIIKTDWRNCTLKTIYGKGSSDRLYQSS